MDYDRRWAKYNARSLALLRPLLGGDPGDVLDLACGTANLLPMVARYVGVDRSAEMLRAARRKFATAALAAGHAVVATARNADAVTAALGDHDDLVAVPLDITDPASVDAAIAAAVERFGRIDVLVNNAGNFYAGYFEEISPAQMRALIETNLFGPLNVTRAVLPVMRAQRSGLVVTVSSTAGIAGLEFCTAYAASKFGLEGWIESLTPEVAPFGIRTMLVEPGFFRTELLTQDSTRYAEPVIADYAERARRTVTAWTGMNGQQGGDQAEGKCAFHGPGSDVRSSCSKP